ncbi:MAG: VWA domain-containing protein, partial [Rhodospirillaceae bacterium]|nr:VWA domain-containing protein [Rhodospirillaceae bacterium]
TNTKATIKSAISKVTNPTGNTNLIMGLMWGWAVLAPKGAGSPFDADSTAEPAAGEGELVRAIVIMTDGDNTQSVTDAYEGEFTDSQLDTRTLAAAQKIKDAGVLIYAIRFGAASNSESLLKQVASGPTAPYYQYAPDAASLTSAFQEIGNHLSKLRLSK